jgi:hypothetical protein
MGSEVSGNDNDNGNADINIQLYGTNFKRVFSVSLPQGGGDFGKKGNERFSPLNNGIELGLTRPFQLV